MGIILNYNTMTHFKDYLRDIHQADKIEQEFDDWIENIQADLLWIYFKEYLLKMESYSKLWKIAYIVLNNQ